MTSAVLGIATTSTSRSGSTAPDMFHQCGVYALPTQFFIDSDGAVRSVAQGPLNLQGASQRVESILPEPSASP